MTAPGIVRLVARGAGAFRYPPGHRALDMDQQAVLVPRWFLDDTRMTALARDNAIAPSTAYEYHGQGAVLATAMAPVRELVAA